ncbi:phage tail tube protein [Shewanella sp. KCT]|uniref:phage tail tube protein n=1 Tax=Shewanella sp. KCT TaxID=2569535 RepID=UPI001182EE2E|nr:phage tail tube protein [Shewanella sp. KCT]TVP11806.1 phage tail protein [Shewanella sp. KCT]
MGTTKKVKGTQLYAIDPADDSLLVVANVTSIEGIDSTIEQIDVTPLEADAREYESGLATPGAATFGVNTNPDLDVHQRLHELKTAGETLQWYLGWSDGKGIEPDVSVPGVVTLPTTRTWLTFRGFLSSFPFSFALNDVVKSSCSIQVSGDPVLIPKAAA